jgi:integrase
VDLGYIPQSDGTRKRKQKWISFRGTRQQAHAKLTELVRAQNRGEFVEPTKKTVGEWLDHWLEKIVKPSLRPKSYGLYRSVCTTGLIPELGAIPLQKLAQPDVQAYLATRAHLAPRTIRAHRGVIRAALNAALDDGIVVKNVATRLKGLPKVECDPQDVKAWTSDEARRFLAAAKQSGARAAAFYAVALDAGLRRAELCGLLWQHVNLETGKVSVRQQLAESKLDENQRAQFSALKTSKPRVIDISAETIRLLRAHKAAQAALMMRNRKTYLDLGLVFAMEPPSAMLGAPLEMSGLSNHGEFPGLVKAAKVRKITFHGLRHTCATLALEAGVPPKVVQERLGHAKIGDVPPAVEIQRRLG